MIRTLALMLICCAAVVNAAERIVVHRAELAGPMGTDVGHLVLTGDALVFVDDTNTQGSFTIPKADIRGLHLENGILTLSLNRPFVNMYGQRQDASIRLDDPSTPGIIAKWAGLAFADTVAPVPPQQLQFDIKHDDDTGRLIVGPTGLSFDALSNPKKSRAWAYNEISEFKHDTSDRDFKLKTYSGEEWKFKITGAPMSREVYDLIADRIIGARRP